MQQYWRVRASYLAPAKDKLSRRYRDNMSVGVLAPTIEVAIAACKRAAPEGAEDVKVWCVNHGGQVDVMEIP